MPTESGLRPGGEIAGYRLEALLGRGGMGAVYLAEDVQLGRKVALKLLAPELAESERFRERFLRESQLAASLDHPHIVPIYAAGEAEGQLYLAMRYVEGYDLRQLLAREGPLAPERALRLLEQVGDALDAAHERGLIHRDVKPGNVLITGRSGREHSYLADFGLTKQTSSISGLTGTGELVGTVQYVSPEQIRGEVVDGRADVYALGCVLYECLSGDTPFGRETEVATLWAHVNEPPPSLALVRPELGREIDRVLARVLAKKPAERPATCGELLSSAGAALGLVPPAAPRRRRSLRLPRVRSRRAMLLAATAGALIVATAAVLLRGDAAPITVPPNSVAVIDPDTNEVTAAIPVGIRPGPITIGGGSVWIGNLQDRTLTRVDPGRRGVAGTVSLGNRTPSGLAFGEGAIWVAHGLLGSLSRVDPQFGQVTRTIDIAGTAFGSPNGGVALGAGSVWAVFGDSTLARIEPAATRLSGKTFAGALPAAIAVDARSIWVANSGDATVQRFNATTFKEGPLRTFTVGRRPAGIALGGGATWVANTDEDVVTRIDPSAGSTSTISVGDGPTAVAVGAGSVWVANTAAGTVSRIDLETNDVVQTIRVGNAPTGIAVGAGTVWVAVQAP